jgi:site-specific DNA-methyltransferase (adenine-specific)
MIELNKIYNISCFDGLKLLDDNSIDLVITDSPYGINYSSFRTNSKIIENDNNLEWVDDFFENLSKKVKIGSHLYCFVDFEMSAEFLFAIRKNWKVRNLLSIPRTIKGNGGDRIFQQQFEYVIFATRGKKDDGRKFNQTQILKPSEGYLKDKRYKAKEWLYRLPDYWYWTSASEFNHDRLHPNQKNVKCIEQMIQLSSDEGNVVLDPFMGSATTAIACKNLNRNYIGYEIDEKYFNICLDRIKNN